jgi:hypothetical protein
MALDIMPLTPDRIVDLATLFDQGGDPKWCWYQSQVGRDAWRRKRQRHSAVSTRVAMIGGQHA